jgi:predicted Zn-dependent protease
MPKSETSPRGLGYNKTMRRAAAVLAIAAISGHALAFAKDKKKDPAEIGDRNVSKGLNFYSLAQEMALGKQLAIEVEKQAKIVDDPFVSEYINRLGQNLARNSDVTFPVTFQLIEADESNAFTLPGGYIFINTGLLKLSANEAELASAIAHELGHAAARHATRQASRNQLVSMGTLPLAVLAGPAARLAANAAVPMAFLKFSREFETEADLLGLQYLWRAGYDPTASIDLFEALESTEKRQPGSVSKLFRTHPLTPDRIEKTQKNIDALLPSREEYVLNTSEYEDIRARVEGFVRTPPQNGNGSAAVLRDTRR